MANAEEEVKEEKIYALSELFDMPKEEFLQLDNAQLFYDQMVYEATRPVFGENCPLICNFIYNTVTEPYTPFEMEKQLKELIDIDGFVTLSPVLSPRGGYYDFLLSVYNDSYLEKYSEEYLNVEVISSDEDILEITKVYYCLRQIAEFDFLPMDYTLSLSYYALGEANNDGALDIMDASFIARCLASGKADELPATADFNANGEIDIRDAADIAQFMAARAAAQAEGWIQ